jgi:hypothetical protein
MPPPPDSGATAPPAAGPLRAGLSPDRVGPDGRVREWQDDHAAVDPGLRHLSHLFAVVPCSTMTPQDTPELARGLRRVARKTASRHGTHGLEPGVDGGAFRAAACWPPCRRRGAQKRLPVCARAAVTVGMTWRAGRLLKESAGGRGEARYEPSAVQRRLRCAEGGHPRCRRIKREK